MKIEFENNSSVEIIPSNTVLRGKRAQYQVENRFGYTLKGQTRISTQGTPANFTCVHCKESYAYYDFKNKEMVCTECYSIEPIEGQETKCGRCENTYTKYTWFDPDCCPNCRKNFVD